MWMPYAADTGDCIYENEIVQYKNKKLHFFYTNY